MWNERSISVILPTYNEAASIAACVRGFEKLGIVDEIIVVNNNAHPDTSPEVAGTSAREVLEPVQGYGSAIRRGFAEATGDLLVVCEPDGTFDPDDLAKLLPFLSDSDFVLGSRTVNDFIYEGANMGRLLRWGNWGLAKLTEVLYGSAYLSDVGCTFRVISRPALERLLPLFETNASAFGYEMMLHAARERMRLVQVPVRYLPRVGTSSVTGDLREAVRLGFHMLGMLLRHRLSGRP
jgi:glycosyltransferase involved in cell wall biosynthesis